MERTTIEIIKITPSEGMVLTNGETYSLDFVHVGKNDSIDNWHEITMEEYEKIMEAVGDGVPDVPENIQEDE